jgi:hypothetical protein
MFQELQAWATVEMIIHTPGPSRPTQSPHQPKDREIMEENIGMGVVQQASAGNPARGELMY